MQHFAAKTAMQRLTTETEKMQCCRRLFLDYRDVLNNGTTCSRCRKESKALENSEKRKNVMLD
jgi:hypothetical protein